MSYQHNRLHTSPDSRNDSFSRPRFQRNSPQSNRTSPSRSEESPIHQKFIKFSKISRVRLDPDDFFQGFSEEFVRPKVNEEDSNSNKKYSRSRENSLVKIKTLEEQLVKREVELEEKKMENERLKTALDKEIEKRRTAEKNLKANTATLSELQRKIREYEVNVAYQAKEIKYLEEKKYTKEERLILSYREKGLMEELKRVRIIHTNNTSQFLDREIERLNKEAEEMRDDNRHLKIAQRTIIHRLVHFQKQLKVAIKLQEEFFEMRAKYQELAKRERMQRKQLQQIKRQFLKTQSTERPDSLDYSQSSTKSLTPRDHIRLTNHHPRTSPHSYRKPNGS